MQRRKRKQTQANPSKRAQTQTNASTPPLLRFFTPPFAIPLVMWRSSKRNECPETIRNDLSVLIKRCVPKTLAFAFGLRLRSKTRCFKTRVLGRMLPHGKPQERLRFRALRSKTLAFKKSIAISFCDLKTSLGARACV